MSAASDFTLGLLQKLAAGRKLNRRQLEGLVHSGYLDAHPDGSHTFTDEGTAALNTLS